MCKHGDETTCRVLMPATLSHTGEPRWCDKGIDTCLAPLVDALNAAGIYTANCCCGHGAGGGSIMLHDGRELLIVEARP